MIQIYRVFGFLLLMASTASLVSLLALLVNQLREPFFILSLIVSLGLGITGTVIYYRRKTDDKEWVISIAFIVGLTIALLLGALIQWVTQ